MSTTSTASGRMARMMLGHGVYVTAFGHPVVPRGGARIRVQVSAAHTERDIDICVRAFVRARRLVTGEARQDDT
jgi:glycine C-acetyltransferase